MSEVEEVGERWRKNTSDLDHHKRDRLDERSRLSPRRLKERRRGRSSTSAGAARSVRVEWGAGCMRVWGREVFERLTAGSSSGGAFAPIAKPTFSWLPIVCATDVDGVRVAIDLGLGHRGERERERARYRSLTGPCDSTALR